MKISIKIICLFVLLPFFASAKYSEIRALDNFTQVDFEGYGELVLIHGDAPSIEIETDGHRRSLRKVYTEVRNGTLYIDQDFDRMDWYDFGRRSVYITLYLTYTNIESIDLEGKINIVSEKAIQADILELDFEGYITGDLELDTHELQMDTEGFMHIDLFGKTDILEIDHEGIGRIDALDLVSNDCDVSVEGTASLYVSASNNLVAESSGFSKILYCGRPVNIDIDRSRFSKIRRYR